MHRTYQGPIVRIYTLLGFRISVDYQSETENLDKTQGSLVIGGCGTAEANYMAAQGVISRHNQLATKCLGPELSITVTDSSAYRPK